MTTPPKSPFLKVSLPILAEYGRPELTADASSVVPCQQGRGIARWVKEPFCGLSHASGAVLSMAGLIALLSLSWGTTWEVVAVSVFGTSMVLVYTASALAHGLHCSPAMAARLDQLDFCAIFLLIAGTYTPICLGPLWGPWGWSLLLIEWSLAILGIASIFLVENLAAHVRVGVYAAMGWLVFIASSQLLDTMSTTGWTWLIAGGACYMTGAVVFLTQRPLLWPGRFNYHDLWHVLALGGSACHFLLVRAVVL